MIKAIPIGISESSSPLRIRARSPTRQIVLNRGFIWGRMNSFVEKSNVVQYFVRFTIHGFM